MKLITVCRYRRETLEAVRHMLDQLGDASLFMAPVFDWANMPVRRWGWFWVHPHFFDQHTAMRSRLMSRAGELSLLRQQEKADSYEMDRVGDFRMEPPEPPDPDISAAIDEDLREMLWGG